MFHKRLIKEFAETRAYIAGNVFTQWLMLIANIVFWFAVSSLLGMIYAGDMTAEVVSQYMIIAVIVIFVRIVLTKVSGDLSFKSSSLVKKRMRSMIFDKLIKIGPSYKDKCSTSQVTQLSTEGVEQLEIYFAKYIPQFFYALLAPVTLFVVVVRIDVTAAVVLLVCVPLIPAAIIAVQKFAKKLLSKYWGNYTELGDNFLENLQGLTTMKIYGSDGYYAEKMHDESEKFRKITMRVLTMQLNSISVMDLVAYGGAALGIIVSLHSLNSGDISVSQCLFIIMMASEFFLPMRLLGSFFHISMNGNAAADRIFELLDMPDDSQEEYIDCNLNKNDNISVSLSHVTFAYDDGEAEVLNDISMEIESGLLVAIAGTSGCGKSTTASLLMGEHDKYQGDICIHGMNVRHMSVHDIMSNVTRITHDSYLFAGTLWDNLLMGIPESKRACKDHEKVKSYMENALKEAQIYDFVMSSGGLMMKINEGASNLSGGQKQRIAIARALLHDSSIYIFDEATSNIDVESEEKIMQVVHQIAHKKTVIVISHRLANVVDADRIYMMESGRIVGSGTHEELLENSAAYKNIYNEQRQLEEYTHSDMSDFIGASEKYGNETEEHITSEEYREESVRDKGQRRLAISIMKGLIGLVKPLVGYMIIAVIMGCIGHLAAIFITVSGGYGIYHIINDSDPSKSLSMITVCLIVMAVLRGILRYAEQACNHFIAFKLLAEIRDHIFAALRRLAPARLDGRGKGNLISMITSDTELLEVFYAHTISPVIIAIIVSGIMVIYMGNIHWSLAVVSFTFYIIVGILVPVINGKIGSSLGMEYRQRFAGLNTIVLDNLRGMKEILQFGQAQNRNNIADNESDMLEKLQKKLKDTESIQQWVTNSAILIGDIIVIAVVTKLNSTNAISFENGILAILAMMSSFGPVAAISSLSNNLNQTLASGDRVLDMLSEKPITSDIVHGANMPDDDICVDKISFAYGDSKGTKILDNFTTKFEKGHITGIVGRSGCGKSTILKLIMRFFETDEGHIYYGGTDVNEITTAKLRENISYVTQDTFLFHDTIAGNLKVAKLDATEAEMKDACIKASVHDFIMGLPDGYDTKLAELGDSLSGGEKQRIGIARAFLSGSRIILLDEPTSNLDSLNEAVIMKSLQDEQDDRTVVVVTHRKSTLGIADTIIQM